MMFYPSNQPFSKQLLRSTALFCLNLIGHRSFSLSVMSWNVNGIRSLLTHDKDSNMLSSLIHRTGTDILCLQETKLQQIHEAEIEEKLRSKYAGIENIFWSSSMGRKGYSGTAILILNKKVVPMIEDVVYGIGDEDGDIEGRSISLHTNKFSIVNVYVPNSGADLKRLHYRVNSWDTALSRYIESLKIKHPNKKLLLVGDLNVAHTALDYHNPQEPRTKKQAGTTPEEQASFQRNFILPDNKQESNTCCNMIDTFRCKYPDQQRYSYFSARLGDRGRQMRLGMRIDYVLLHDPAAQLSSKSDSPESTMEFEPYIEESVSERSI